MRRRRNPPPRTASDCPPPPASATTGKPRICTPRRRCQCRWTRRAGRPRGPCSHLPCRPHGPPPRASQEVSPPPRMRWQSERPLHTQPRCTSARPPRPLPLEVLPLNRGRPLQTPARSAWQWLVSEGPPPPARQQPRRAAARRGGARWLGGDRLLRGRRGSDWLLKGCLLRPGGGLLGDRRGRPSCAALDDMDGLAHPSPRLGCRQIRRGGVPLLRFRLRGACHDCLLRRDVDEPSVHRRRLCLVARLHGGSVLRLHGGVFLRV
mmetsp:Transcript_24877/g.77332  ORF Transcript_24877/g.77332 Transcript_24877/m.77332 type:complete len:264 (+) Transcript_24877:450-1241(+)